jgi:adenosylcobinamide-GDP ribazoletransferase
MSQRQLDAARLRAALIRWTNEVRLAASFLTIIPVGGNAATSADLVASLGWFPLIGFALGGALAFADYLLGFFILNAVRATLIVLALTAISGAVHLDGLADTADALGAGRDRMRALGILRDSRIGTFGATATFFALALKVAVLASTTGHAQIIALYLAPGMARWAMVAAPYKLTYLRESGAGSALLGVSDERNLRVATAIVLIAILPVTGIHALHGLIIALILVWALRAFYRRWLGGITGDLIGAAGELVESAVLIAVAG